MDWVPIVFITFKGAVCGTCMFFAIKWHYDQGKKKGKDKRVALRGSSMLAAALVLGIVIAGITTVVLMSPLDMSLP
jgi:heme A synthase